MFLQTIIVKGRWNMLWMYTFTALEVLPIVFLCLSITKKDYTYILYALGSMWMSMRLCMLWQGWDVKCSFAVGFIPGVFFYVSLRVFLLLEKHWNQLFHKTYK